MEERQLSNSIDLQKRRRLLRKVWFSHKYTTIDLFIEARHQTVFIINVWQY